MKKIYSAGKIHITPKGDVYHIFKHKGDKGFHASRHTDGKLHWKSRTTKRHIRNLKSINDFSGFEVITTQGFDLESLPNIFDEYKIKKSDGIFAIDMRSYEKGRFNLSVAIFTDEGIPTLLNSFPFGHKKQIYLYTNCNPKIALIALEIKKGSV